MDSRALLLVLLLAITPVPATAVWCCCISGSGQRCNTPQSPTSSRCQRVSVKGMCKSGICMNICKSFVAHPALEAASGTELTPLIAHPALEVAGGTVKLSWKDCGDASTHGKVTSLTPDTLVFGQKTTITGSGSLDEKVTSGSYTVAASVEGKQVFTHTSDLCKPDTIRLPFGIGSIVWNGVSCPHAAGATSIGLVASLSRFIPAKGPSVEIKVTAVATSGDKLVCVTVDTAPAGVSAITV